jgi:hypothetical protein
MKLATASVLMSSLLLLCASAAFGQASSGTLPPSGSAGSLQGVKGAPYCAAEETENTQTLTDGTHIKRIVHRTKVCRDSEGRTRREEFFITGPGRSEDPSMINIFDPVAQVIYFINPRARTATRAVIPPAKTPANPAPDGSATTAGVVGVIAGTTGELPNPNIHPQFSREDIGTQEIEGIYTLGHRVTTTWPVGAFGNDRPVSTVCEEWSSPDLRVMVLRTCSDPRNGDTITRLKNIDRGEPDPSLFQSPADYKVVDQKGPS